MCMTVTSLLCLVQTGLYIYTYISRNCIFYNIPCAQARQPHPDQSLPGVVSTLVGAPRGVPAHLRISNLYPYHPYHATYGHAGNTLISTIIQFHWSCLMCASGTLHCCFSNVCGCRASRASRFDTPLAVSHVNSRVKYTNSVLRSCIFVLGNTLL